jgi:hypothetical protein
MGNKERQSIAPFLSRMSIATPIFGEVRPRGNAWKTLHGKER